MSTTDSNWSTGLTIVAAVAVGAAILGGALWQLDAPGGDWTAVGGALVGGVIGFVAISYALYGR